VRFEHESRSDMRGSMELLSPSWEKPIGMVCRRGPSPASRGETTNIREAMLCSVLETSHHSQGLDPVFPPARNECDIGIGADP
jgi:hypothetical protein